MLKLRVRDKRKFLTRPFSFFVLSLLGLLISVPSQAQTNLGPITVGGGSALRSPLPSRARSCIADSTLLSEFHVAIVRVPDKRRLARFACELEAFLEDTQLMLTLSNTLSCATGI